MAARQLKCLLLPVGANPLIVPNSAVAEVITLDEIRPRGDTPEWFLGSAQWRGYDIPLVDFAYLAGQRDEVAPAGGRYVVLFAFGTVPSFYGVRIDSLPHTETVDGDNLRPADSGTRGGLIRARAVIDTRDETRECVVPDLEAIESAIAAQSQARV